MPTTTLNNTLPTQRYDYVGVFDQNFNEVFPNARTLKATIKEEAKVMEHPVETGAIITDHRIILPVEIELSLIVEFDNREDTYKIIRQLYLASTLLIVQTNVGVYQNQLIASMPHDEDPDYFDAITIVLKLKQVQFTTAKYSVVPKSPRHASTVDRGTQQGTPTPRTSVAVDGFNAIGNGTKRFLGLPKAPTLTQVFNAAREGFF
jgi:hypothetical protein